MREIWNNLLAHIKADVHPRTYLGVGGFIALLLFLNYFFEVESRYLAHFSAFHYWLYTTALFFGVYYGAVFIKSGSLPFQDRHFLGHSAFILAIASLASSLLFVREWTDGLTPHAAHFANKLLFNSLGSVIGFLGLTVLFFAKDRKHLTHFYGLRFFTGHSLWPYFGVLLIIVPFIYGAALQPHFLETYPIFRMEHHRPVFGLDIQSMAVLFESVYLFDFIRVELIFRGALVIGMARFLGKDTVLTCPFSIVHCTSTNP